MPQVPSQDSFQVSSASMPGGGLRAPEYQDFGNQTSMRVGGQLQEGGNAVSRVALDMQNEANKLRVNDAMNKVVNARMRLTYDPNEGFLTVKGDKALNWSKDKSLDQDYAERYQQEIEAISEGLGNDMQRQLFRAAAGAEYNRMVGTVKQHLAGEFMQVQKDNREATYATAQRAASLEPSNAATYRGAIEKAVQADPSLTDETRKKELVDRLSPMHAGAIGTLINRGNLSKAQEHFDKYKDEMTPAARAAIEERMKARADAQVGITTANQIFAKAVDGKPLTAAIPTADLNQQLIKTFTNADGVLDVEKYQAAKGELANLVGLRNKQQAETEAGAIEGVYGLRNQGMTLAQVKSRDEWKQLSERNKALLEKQWQEDAEISLSNDIKRMQQREQFRRLSSAPTMLRYTMDPEALSKLSNADITRMVPEIGFGNADELKKMRDGLLKSRDSLTQGTIDNEMFKTIAAGAGVNIAPAKNDKEGAYALLSLRNTVEQEIGIRQASKGRPLSAEEKQAAMSDVISRRVLQDGFFGKKEVMATSVMPADLQNSKVQINTPSGKQTIVIGSIPAGEYSDISAELRKRGQNPTPAAVAQVWNDIKNSSRQATINAIPGQGPRPSAADQIPR